MKNNTLNKYYVLILICFVFTFNIHAQIGVTETFETGNFPSLALWQDGGSRCDIINSGRLNGNYIVELFRDGSEANTFTSNMDLTSYSSVDISFYFEFRALESNDDVILEFSNNGGGTYTNIATINRGGSFPDNDTDYNTSYTVLNSGGTAFSTTSRFRFKLVADNNEYVYLDDILISGTLIVKPEIDIIDVDGDPIDDGGVNSPALLNDTDFGSVNSGSSVTKTYTIENNGNTNLNISSWSSSNGDYVVDNFGLTVIPFGSSTTFDVTFTPSGNGTISSIVTINNDDFAPEDEYTFNVQGVGVVPFCSSTVVTLPYSESFETGSNGWNSGGANALRVNNAAYAYDNSYSLNIRSTSGSASAFCSPLMDLTAYDKVDFKFFFYAEGFELDETFTVQYSDNDGASWQVVRTFKAGDTAPANKSGDFQQGTSSTDFYVRNIGLLSTDYNFSANSRFRIESNASDTGDNIYIDNISIKGVTYATPTIGPGGITTDLSLWLQADKLDGSTVGTDGALVTSWIDTGIGNDAEVTETGNEPTYRNDASRNINFNPVIDFTNNNNTAGGDMTYLDGREVLEGTAGFNSNDIFMVVIPDTQVTTSTYPLDTFTSFDVTADNTYVEDVTGFGFGNYSARFSDETFGFAIGITNDELDPIPGFGRAHTTGGDTPNMNQISIINTRHNTNNLGTPSDIEIYQNAKQIGNFTNDATDFSQVTEQKFWLGRSQYWQGSFDGRIAEVITYTDRKDDVSDTDPRNRIQTYLAVKYGITLKPTITADVILEGNLDYVVDGAIVALSTVNDPATPASVIWDVSENSGFNYDIAGIGRDDASELDQRQSSSINSIEETFTITPDLPAVPYSVTVETRGIITMGLTSIEATNSANKIANPVGFTDKNFLMWGSNNAALDAPTSTITVDMSSGAGKDVAVTTPVEFESMARIWKVVENGSIGRVQVSIPQDAILNIDPPGNYLMFISDTNVFTPTAQYRVMTSDGNGNLKADYDFNGIKYVTFGYAKQIDVERSIKFVASNGNYIDVEDNLDLNNAFTISAWVKRDAGSTNTSILAKRDLAYTQGYDLKINASNQFEMSWLNGSMRTITSTVTVPEDEWHHVAVTHDGSDATMYIDGVEAVSSSLPLPLQTTESFLIAAAGRESNAGAYFDGNIDEVRLWSTPLTQDEIRYLMNQELEDNTFIGAYFNSRTITPTKNDISGLDYSDLQAYFPMSKYTYTNTNDESDNNLTGYLRLLRTVDGQTAPLPYVSFQDGNWTDDTTWTYGSFQMIPGSRSIVNNDVTVDWNIVETAHDITIDNTTLFDGNDNEGNRTVLAHVLDSGIVTVDGDNTLETGFGYTVTHYLEMNGKMDLEGESQLIQTTDSDLILGPSGQLEKDQQGTSNKYRYNYWGSPVGAIGMSTDALNPTNTNRYSYRVTDIFYDGIDKVNFTGVGNDGENTSPVTVADYWIWKFANNTDGDYSEWQHMRQNGSIEAGEGFTMKGTDAVGLEQNYTFLGKPNNADVNLEISQYNDYLVGNPYASAIDARQFIIDNGPTLYYEDEVTPEADATTSGTLYFWEHWGGNDHILANYQGGYGTYNLSGGLAAPFSLVGTNDPDVGSGGTPTKIPGRYIPVGQGFFVVAANGGTINFNNGQRVFKKESTSNGVFFRSNASTVTSNDVTDNNDLRKKIKLGFDSVGNYHRQLLLTIDENTTPDVDWGYDGTTYEYLEDDMFWKIDNNFYVIQASDNMNEDTSYPLIIYTSEDGNNTIKIDELVNIDTEQEIYLHDKELDFYHDLKEGDYEIFLNAGYYDSRFEIVFKDQSQSLSIDDDIINEEKLDVRYSNSTDKVVLINPHGLEVKDIQIFNILGQHVVAIEDIKTGNFTEYNVGNLSSGPYIIKLNTVSGSVSKKVLVD